MADRRVHLRIRGRVQGVAFRYYTRRTAEKLGVVGWVRNRRDGSVEAVAEGDETAMEKFVEWCGQGPSSARVSDIDVDWLDPANDFSKFSIARTE